MPAEQAHIPVIHVGCDPEFFVRDKKTKKLVSAHSLIPGTKEEPFKVEFGAIQVDGIATEVNIVPATVPDIFIHNISKVKEQLLAHLNSKEKDKYELVVSPVAFFEKEDWEQIPEEPKVLGCNPDYNAWTGEANDSPPDRYEYPVMRTAAGHVHIGWCEKRDPNDPMHFMDCVQVAKQMDYYLGLPSLLWDHDSRRRLMYGKAGAFRPKSYGMEYRVPSNVWCRNKDLMNYVHNSTVVGMRKLFQGHIAEEKFGDLAKRLIDENTIGFLDDVQEAYGIFNTLGIPKPPVSHDMLHPTIKKEEVLEVKTGTMESPFEQWTKPSKNIKWLVAKKQRANNGGPVVIVDDAVGQLDNNF